jgi:hypothetical protein
MALLGQTKWKTYLVTLADGDDVFNEHIMAPDAEHAAWVALELSDRRTCTLKDVRLEDEW